MEKNNQNIRVKQLKNVSQTTTGTKALLAVFFAGWVLFCVVFQGKIQNGFYMVCNHLLERYGNYSGRICLFFQADEKRGFVWFWTAVVWIAFLLAVCLVKRSRKSWRYIWTKTLFLSGTALAGMLLCKAAQVGRTDVLITEKLQSVVEKCDDIRYGTNEKAGLYNGDLRKATEQKENRRINKTDTDEDGTMLEVVMTQPQSLYLRGFVGEYYADGQWTSMDNAKKYESRELFYWLHKYGFYGYTRLGRLGKDNGFTQENVINIKNVSADRRYIYTPYELLEYTALDEKKIGDTYVAATGLTGMVNYRYTACVGIRSDYLQIQQQSGTGQSSTSQSGTNQSTASQSISRQNADVEQHYRQWVYENYLAIPETFEKQFQSVFQQKAVLTGTVQVSEAKRLILQYLTDYCTGKEEFGVCTQGDPLLYFLQQSRRGYDVHYASAATLMFRYLGVPARYVEGFWITEQRAEAIEKSSVVSLGAEDAHAWTEIYIDGIGWVPFEATPYCRDMIKEAEDIHVIASKDTEEQHAENVESSQTEEKELSKQEAALLAGEVRENQKETKHAPVWRWLLVLIAVVFIVVILLIIVIFLNIRKKKKLLMEAVNHPDRVLACQNIFACVMTILEKKGFIWQDGSFEDNRECLQKLFSDAYADLFEEMWLLHEQIRFGGKTPQEEIYLQMKDFLEVSQKILENS